MADHVNEPHNNGLLWHVESSQDLTPNQPKGSIRTPKQPQGPIMTNTQSTTTFHKEKHPINNHKVPSGKTPNQQPQGSIRKNTQSTTTRFHQDKHPINNHKVLSGQSTTRSNWDKRTVKLQAEVLCTVHDTLRFKTTGKECQWMSQEVS